MTVEIQRKEIITLTDMERSSSAASQSRADCDTQTSGLIRHVDPFRPSIRADLVRCGPEKR